MDIHQQLQHRTFTFRSLFTVTRSDQASFSYRLLASFLSFRHFLHCFLRQDDFYFPCQNDSKTVRLYTSRMDLSPAPVAMNFPRHATLHYCCASQGEAHHIMIHRYATHDALVYRPLSHVISKLPTMNWDQANDCCNKTAPFCILESDSGGSISFFLARSPQLDLPQMVSPLQERD